MQKITVVSKNIDNIAVKSEGAALYLEPFILAQVVVTDRTGMVHVLQTVDAQRDQAAATERTMTCQYLSEGSSDSALCMYYA